jgi:hypothetical protein
MRRHVSKDDPESTVAAFWSILRDTKLCFAPRDEGRRKRLRVANTSIAVGALS